MHTQGHLNETFNDAQQTRKVTRVIYHKDYNEKTNVSILLRLFYIYGILQQHYTALYKIQAIALILVAVYCYQLFWFQLYDIAVLSIDPPITYSKDISPVCLPPANHDADQFVGKDAAIMGWGTLKFGIRIKSRIFRLALYKTSMYKFTLLLLF